MKFFEEYLVHFQTMLFNPCLQFFALLIINNNLLFIAYSFLSNLLVPMQTIPNAP
jgi:hypothetical protein